MIISTVVEIVDSDVQLSQSVAQVELNLTVSCGRSVRTVGFQQVDEGEVLLYLCLGRTPSGGVVSSSDTPEEVDRLAGLSVNNILGNGVANAVVLSQSGNVLTLNLLLGLMALSVPVVTSTKPNWLVFE